MRVSLVLVAVASVAHAGNEPQLKAVTSVLRDAYSDTQARALADAQRAFGLDPTRFTERAYRGNDIAVLPGCRRFTDAERARAQSEVERWLATHEPKTALLEIHPGCWLHGRGVIGATWVIDPDVTEKSRSAVFRVGDRGLVLVERTDDDVHTVELTSAGDLDNDGALDFAYWRVAYGKQYVVISLDGIATVVTSRPDDDNHYAPLQPTFVAIDGRRGVTVARDANGALLENGYGPPVFASALESWRLQRDKFVHDPDLDQRLTAATASMRSRAHAADWLHCAAQCPMSNSTNHDEQRPCWLGHESEIRQSIKLLGNGAGLRDAFSIIEASRDTCFPPRARPRAAR
jgi:hypothetical protein